MYARPLRIILFAFADMSLTSKLVLGASCVFSCGIIGYVHFKQKIDRYVQVAKKLKYYIIHENNLILLS